MENAIRTPALRLRKWTRRGCTALTKATIILRLWRRRARTRLALSRLDADRLRDIGITHTQAKREAEKPFWRR